MSYHMFPHLSQVKLPGNFRTTLRTREVTTRTHLKDDRPERGSVQLPVIVEHTLTKLGSENFKDHDPITFKMKLKSFTTLYKWDLPL